MESCILSWPMEWSCHQCQTLLSATGAGLQKVETEVPGSDQPKARFDAVGQCQATHLHEDTYTSSLKN